MQYAIYYITKPYSLVFWQKDGLSLSPGERSVEKRQRVHQAAMTLFMQNGFEGTSMDALASLAGVSKPTLYRYYPNKEALFVAILSELVLTESPETVLPDPQTLGIQSVADLEEALIDWAQAVMVRATQPEYLGLVRLMVAEMPRFPALGSLFAGAIPQQGGAYLAGLLRYAESQGIIRVADTEAVIRLIVGGLLTYSLNGLFGGSGRAPTREQVAAIIHIVIRALSA
jgi:TetR/AcrR family transcriptional regulator, mexJK operon transcriptional repressor